MRPVAHPAVPFASAALHAVLLLSLLPTGAYAADRLRFVETSLTFPGAAVALVSADVDGDGNLDLAVFVVGSRWGEAVTWESSRMDEVEGLVEVMTVVPTLFDRRELWLYLGDGEGGLRSAGPPLEMPLSVLSLARGHGEMPLLALTDEGVAAVVWEPEATSGSLVLVPVVTDPPILTGSGAFVPGLRLTSDVDGDGTPELLLPARDGIAIYRGTPEGFAPEPAVRGLAPPREPGGVSGAPSLAYPLPEVGDVTGDGQADLVWQDPTRGWRRPWVAVHRGGLVFDDPRPVFESDPDAPDVADPLASLASIPAEPAATDEVEALHYGDLDGDGRAELVVLVMDAEPEDLGMRKSIRWAESPPGTAFVHPTQAGFAPAAASRESFRIQGYAFTGNESEFQLPGGFRDLNGDGRLDLVTLTLQISVTRLLGGLAVGRVTLPMDFHVWCQEAGGAFRPVAGLDLSGKFRLDIGDLKVRNLPSFAGDFDGDGRTDFVQLGRGTKVTIHTGDAGCAFPSRADLTLRLKKEPEHIDLVRVEDFDGDGRSDLVVTHPLPRREADVVPPTRLDLYLSGGQP